MKNCHFDYFLLQNSTQSVSMRKWSLNLINKLNSEVFLQYIFLVQGILRGK